MGRQNVTRPAIRVLFPPIYPLVFHKECLPKPCLLSSKKYLHPGFFAELMNLLLNALDYRMEPIFIGDVDTPFEPQEYHVKWASPMTGDLFREMLNYVRNGSVDFIAYPVHRTYHHELEFDISIPIFTSIYKIAYRGLSARSKDKSSFWSFLTIYSHECKLAICVIFVLQSVLYVCNEFMAKKDARKRNSDKLLTIVKCVFLAARVQFGKPVSGYTKTTAARFGTAWSSFLTVVVVLGIYSQLMTAKLVIVETEAGLNRVEDVFPLLRSQSYHLFNISTNEWFYEMLNDETAFPFPQLREILEINPMISINDFKQSPTEVIYNEGMLIGQVISSDMYNLVTHCSINTVEEGLFKASSHFIYKRGSKIRPKIDRFLLENIVPIQHLYRKYEQLMESLHRNCAISEHKIKTSRPFFGVCLAMIFPVLTALLIFVMELFWWHLRSRRYNLSV